MIMVNNVVHYRTAWCNAVMIVMIIILWLRLLYGDDNGTGVVIKVRRLRKWYVISGKRFGLWRFLHHFTTLFQLERLFGVIYEARFIMDGELWRIWKEDIIISAFDGRTQEGLQSGWLVIQSQLSSIRHTPYRWANACCPDNRTHNEVDNID
jgi:hypothetical protein